MKKFLSKSITFLCAFVTLISCLVPASAADTPDKVGMTFWDFLNYQIDKVKNPAASSFGGGAGCSAAAYAEKVKKISDVLGSSTVGDNCVYLGNWSDVVRSDNPSSVTFKSGSTFSYTCGNSSDGMRYVLCSSSFVAPVTGTYVLTGYGSGYSQSISYSSNVNHNCFDVPTSGGLVSPSCSYTFTVGSTYTISAFIGIPKSSTVVFSGAVRVEFPLDSFKAVASSGDIDITDNTRAGKFSGDYFYEGDNGQQIIADKVTLFNETTKTVTNPATGKTETAKEWFYDYSDRSYHYTTDTGNKGIVKYGDDNASVTMQDANGNTVTYNYYYYAKTASGGDTGGGSSSSGTTIPATKEGIFSAIIKAVGEFGSSIFSGIAHIIASIVKGLTEVIDFLFGSGDSGGGLDFYNKPTTFGGQNVWAS